MFKQDRKLDRGHTLSSPLAWISRCANFIMRLPVFVCKEGTLFIKYINSMANISTTKNEQIVNLHYFIHINYEYN